MSDHAYFWLGVIRIRVRREDGNPKKTEKSIAAIEYPVSRVVGIYMKLKQAIRLFDRRERLREQLRAKDAYPFGSLRRVRKHRQIGAVEAELRRQFDVCSL